jgi:hypothetical protein
MEIPFKPGDYISFVLDEGKQVTFKFNRSKKLPRFPYMVMIDGDFDLFEKRILSKQDDPCWKGYRMYGHKKKKGTKVPNCVPEAEYKGRDVDLNKPKRSTDGKGKFHVYVKHPKTDKVVRVNFGDPNMEIKRDDPTRRKSFRARHGCDNLNFSDDRHTARWWSCQMWRSDKTVSDMLSEDDCGCSDAWQKDKHSNKEMVKRHLYNLAKQSIEIYNMLDTDCEIKPWMHSKIARCTGDLDAVYHTLEYDNDVLSESSRDLNVSKLGNFLKSVVDFCENKGTSCWMMDLEGNKLSKFSDVALELRNNGAALLKSQDGRLEINLVLVGNTIKHTAIGKHSKEFEQMHG